jgi:hypothetical protein
MLLSSTEVANFLMVDHLLFSVQVDAAEGTGNVTRIVGLAADIRQVNQHYKQQQQ